VAQNWSVEFTENTILRGPATHRIPRGERGKSKMAKAQRGGGPKRSERGPNASASEGERST